MIKHVIRILMVTVLISLFLYGCRSDTTPLPLYRDGVVDMPTEAAPDEVWEAAKLWKKEYRPVSVVVMSPADSPRTVLYMLDIGFESKDWKEKCDEYHKKLLEMGWKLKGKRNYYDYTCTGDGRILHIGFDRGRHPTTMIIKFEKDETGVVKKVGMLPHTIHQHPLVVPSVIPEGDQNYLDIVKDGLRTGEQIIVVYPIQMNQPIDRNKVIQIKGKLYRFDLKKPADNKLHKKTHDTEAIEVYEWKYVK